MQIVDVSAKECVINIKYSFIDLLVCCSDEHKNRKKRGEEKTERVGKENRDKGQREKKREKLKKGREKKK